MKFKQLEKKEVREAEQKFLEHYAVIKDILKTFPARYSHAGDISSQDEVPRTDRTKELPARLFPAKNPSEEKPTVARTVEQLEAKLSVLKSKTRLAYKEKLVKRGLKSRLKKKEKKEKRRLIKKEKKSKQAKQNTEEVSSDNKTSLASKAAEEEQLLFNKIELPDGSSVSEDILKQKKRAPKDELKRIREREKRWKRAVEEGGEEEQQKVDKAREKGAWRAALMRTHGQTVKDDPQLLKTSIARLRKKKEKSALKWKANEERVKKDKQERQRKRAENLKVRAKTKKTKKLKTLAKRGRIIPGY